MTRIAIWCRHKDDNIIGIGPNIPWHIPTDFKRFRRLTEEKNLIAGQTTYESFPNRTLPNRNIFVLTFNEKYEVSDPKNHFVVTDYKDFKDAEEDFYIAGGASVYKLFMQNMPPAVIVDSEYQGDIDSKFEGEKIDISFCVEQMKKHYTKITPDYDEDNVLTSVWVRRGEFVSQEVLKHIIYKLKEKKL